MTTSEAADALAEPGVKASIAIVWNTQTGEIDVQINRPGGPGWAMAVLSMVLHDWKQGLRAGPQ